MTRTLQLRDYQTHGHPERVRKADESKDLHLFFVTAGSNRSFERARLQSCRKQRKIDRALAPEGSSSIPFTEFGMGEER
jgi:hypothetical protein